MTNILTYWKYNNQTILTTKETDFHCSIQSVKIWQEQDQVKFSLLTKSDLLRQVFQFPYQKGVNNLEVWTANGKYHQHDIPLLKQ